jgi:hypothetical protein
MDATELARRLLGPIPAHLTLGLEVVCRGSFDWSLRRR